MEEGRAVEGAEPRHGCPRLVRRLNGACGVGPGPFWQRGDELTGRRADGVEGLTAFRVDPSPAHEHLEGLRFLDDFHGSGQPSSDSRVQYRVFADLDERFELLIDGRVDPGVFVVGQELLPLLVRDPVRGARSHPLPTVVVFGRGDPGTVEAGPVMPHRVLRAEVVSAGADL